jgi:hypothetical protein
MEEDSKVAIGNYIKIYRKFLEESVSSPRSNYSMQLADLVKIYREYIPQDKRVSAFTQANDANKSLRERVDWNFYMKYMNDVSSYRKSQIRKQATSPSAQ